MRAALNLMNLTESIAFEIENSKSQSYHTTPRMRLPFCDSTSCHLSTISTSCKGLFLLYKMMSFITITITITEFISPRLTQVCLSIYLYPSIQLFVCLSFTWQETHGYSKELKQDIFKKAAFCHHHSLVGRIGRSQNWTIWGVCGIELKKWTATFCSLNVCCIFGYCVLIQPSLAVSILYYLHTNHHFLITR